MAKAKHPFNVKVFLSTVNGGRSVSNYRTHEKVFSQGDPADSVFYIQEGKVKVCVTSELGKEAVIALASHFSMRPPLPCGAAALS